MKIRNVEVKDLIVIVKIYNFLIFSCIVIGDLEFILIENCIFWY